MNARLRLSAAGSSRRHHGRGAAQKSWDKVFDRPSGGIAGPGAAAERCPRGFRARFAAQWARFLRDHYRCPEEVAVNFGVTYQCARNWWDGLNRPSGDAVALAFLRHPDLARCFGEVER